MLKVPTECRQRRIRCGEERPACYTCSKSKRPCSYAARAIKDPLAVSSQTAMRSSRVHSEPPPPENPSKPGSPLIKHSAQAKSTPMEFQRSSFEAEAGTAKTDYSMKPKGDDHTEANNSPSINPTNADSGPDELIDFLPVASHWRDRFHSRTSSTKKSATRPEEEAIGTAKGSSDKLPTDIAPSRGLLSLATGKELPHSGHRHHRKLWSPTLSDSSRDSGLERPSSHAIAPPTSPMFRAENNTQGSSPNCLGGQMNRSTSRRSSRSSSPTIKQAFSFSSEEAVGQPSRYNLGTTLRANVRIGRRHAPAITGLDPRGNLQVRDTEVPSLQDLAENEHTASKAGNAQDRLPHSNKGTDAETSSLTGHWSLPSVAWCLSLFPTLRMREAPLAAGKTRIKWICVSVEGA